MAKLVSKTYGEALFELATEEHILEDMTQEVTAVKDVFAQNPELVKLLNHPKIGKEEKLQVVENVFKGRISDYLVGFLLLVVQKDRYQELPGIFTYFLEQVKRINKIGVAEVTSAVPLSDAQREQVQKRLLETTDFESFEMQFQVDPSLIGGMVIRVGDRVVDSSIRTRLDTMAKELSAVQL